ncbi:hypothetical protein STIAU_8082 [Stigmatella aurantiaca DW4/3-1]|uniref:Uncharacterized protein n=1 Tax=Stigmatella aurantiaca (strain DW4/3-1) TaxID=378806 RepID=Q08XW3_STIAD|nr:hypothetical protein STIAU_8082 [Stigmatella aurantiaca DW4/3-1]
MANEGVGSPGALAFAFLAGAGDFGFAGSSAEA